MTDNLSAKKYALALGFFDGLHTAHKKVLDEAVKKADSGFIPAVLLFDEHPRNVISGGRVPCLLQNEKRDEMLRKMGITPLFVSFSDIKDMSPEEFVRDILADKLSAGAVVCGYNYSFGKNASGNAQLLKKICMEYEISVTVVDGVTLHGEEISSTRIRNAVKEGRIEEANEMLGFPFTYSSEIFVGDRRGRLLGAPTVNQFLPDGIVLPKFGVYASRVYFEGKEYIGVTNIGSRPTFQGESVRSETYIIDYSGDLYGKTVEIELYRFIRREQKFPDGDALKSQISKDVNAAREYFSEVAKKIKKS